MRSLRFHGWVLVFVMSSACGPEDGTDDTGDGSGSSAATEPSATSSATVTNNNDTNDPDSGTQPGAPSPIDCPSTDFGMCGSVEACLSIKGTEAVLQDVPGEYSCSDLSLPFGCEPADCDPFAGIVCRIDDPGVAQRVLEGCVPTGWEPCPDDAMCV